MQLVDVLENAAVNAPAAVALTVPDGPSTTFGELREQVARLEAVVRARSEPGARVAILSDNTPVYVRARWRSHISCRRNVAGPPLDAAGPRVPRVRFELTLDGV